MVESTLDLDAAKDNDFIVKPDFDEELQGGLRQFQLNYTFICLILIFFLSLTSIFFCFIVNAY